MTDNTDIQVADVAEGTIDDNTLAEWEKRVGLELRIGNIWNQNASYEAIRNFSNGIGDANPLYRDVQHAAHSRYGSLVASPAWTASVFPHWGRDCLEYTPTIRHQTGSSSDLCMSTTRSLPSAISLAMM